MINSRTESRTPSYPERGWLTVPNILTLARLLLTPLAVRELLQRDYVGALLVFALAGATDGLDGYLARRLDCRTKFGAYIDPIADKALLSATYVALGITGLAPLWLVFIVFGRDLLILACAGAAMRFAGQRDFPPSVWGKLSTALQMATALALIVAPALPLAALAWAADVLPWAAAAATAWSGFHYGWRAVKTLREPRVC